MAELTRSVFRAGRVLEALFADDFQGKTILELCRATDIGYDAVRRYLTTWQALGWVVEMPVGGSKESRWKIGRKLVEIAHAYERHALDQVHDIKNEFHEITGKELNA